MIHLEQQMTQVLYVYTNNYGKENFYFHELTNIVRQKNKHFAQLLNRVQEGQITEHDETTLKARVTTLDNPDHFTDTLHVYGTNQQADHYNAAMLQKLDTPKYIIQSSDITRDRHKAGEDKLRWEKMYRYRRTSKSLNNCRKCLCKINI